MSEASVEEVVMDAIQAFVSSCPYCPEHRRQFILQELLSAVGVDENLGNTVLLLIKLISTDSSIDSTSSGDAGKTTDVTLKDEAELKVFLLFICCSGLLNSKVSLFNSKEFNYLINKIIHFWLDYILGICTWIYFFLMNLLLKYIFDYCEILRLFWVKYGICVTHGEKKHRNIVLYCIMQARRHSSFLSCTKRIRIHQWRWTSAFISSPYMKYQHNCQRSTKWYGISPPCQSKKKVRFGDGITLWLFFVLYFSDWFRLIEFT